MAQLKNTTISDTGSIDLPVGTTGQRPGSPIAGMIRYNTTLSETEYYDGTAWRPLSDSNPEATGGTIVDTDIGGVPYRIHYFTNTGNTNFVVTKGGEVEYLIVAGGGSGGSRHAGGGGSGGLLMGVTTVTPQSYTITVGPGGIAVFNTGTTQSFRGVSGANSSSFGLTAIGGGGGGAQSLSAGLSGGSGGGGGERFSPPGGAGTAGQGNAGGIGSLDGDYYGGGGGGGGGSPGQNAQVRALISGGNGGQGILSTIAGVSNFYAGGGGGSAYGNSQSLDPTVKNHGEGGLGGGGSGGTSAGVAGVSNTGGGGGGGSSNGDATGIGGNGGSGIVIVRYRRNSTTATSPNIILNSTLPYISANNLEKLFVSNTGLVTYVDAGNPSSYPGTGSTLLDLSGNGYNANFVSTPTFVNKFRGIINLDGQLDYIEFSSPNNRFAWTPSGATSNNISLEIWLRAIDLEAMFISKPWNGNGGYNYYIQNGSMYLATSQGHSASFSGFELNKWEYICVVVTPTQIGIYRNGIIDAAFTNHSITSNAHPSGDSSLALTWGSLYPYGGGGNPGFSPHQDVAILRFYNRILSGSEVLNHYQSERGRFNI